MTIPQAYRFTKDHEWLDQLADGTVRIGITDYAQAELGDVVFVELPEVGAQFKKGESFASVESVKAVSDVYAPVSGKVIAVNNTLVDGPELLNKSPHTEGWMIALQPSDKAELTDLMDATGYDALLSEISK